MNIKLLKKVRKRFKIMHYPNGVEIFGDRYDYNLYELHDDKDIRARIQTVQLGVKENSNIQFCSKERIFHTEKECIIYLKTMIIKILREEGYRGRKDKLIKLNEKRVY
jgi:hypothetical protein